MAKENSVRRVVVVQTGGLGDLVLASGLLTGIKKAQPDFHLTLICKAAFASVARLYPVPPDEVIALESDPHAWSAPSAEFFAAFRPLSESLAGRRADVLIDATFQPSWLGWMAAAVLGAGRACRSAAHPVPEVFVSAVLEKLELPLVPLENVDPDPERREPERYRKLLRWLGLEPQQVFPWEIPQSARQRAAEALARFRFQDREYLACFPCGSLGAEAKRWPVAHFRRVLVETHRKWGLPLLLVGENREREALEELAAALRGDCQNVAVYTGGPGDIPVLAGLLANARAYLGNDTGPAHIASAYNIPGVTIYGGGHWPAYAPWGPGSVGLVHPLPCFGCDWDCLFGQGLCVEAIRPETVIESLDAALRNLREGPEVRTFRNVGEDVERVIAAVTPRYRAAQRDRADRWTCMIRQNAALERAEIARRRIEAEAERRAADVEKLTAWLRERDARIGELEIAAAQRLEALEELREENVRLSAALFALEREKLVHSILRRIRKRPLSV